MMIENNLAIRIMKRNERNSNQTKHILFIIPSISDEHTVYFLNDHIQKYLDDENYYCTFMCTRSKYALPELVDKGDSIILFQKASANFNVLKSLFNILKTSGVKEYLKNFPEFDFAHDVNEVHILGGSEFVFPKKTYSKNAFFNRLENSFHDVLEDGYEDQINEIFTNEPLVHFPISTFMFYYAGVANAVIVSAKIFGQLEKVIMFCVDPTATIRHLKMYDIDTTEYYIAEDKRGSRNFEFFDFSKGIKKGLEQYKESNWFDPNEKIDFVFGGRLSAANREVDYERFFANLHGIKKKIFTPSTMSLKDKNTITDIDDFYPPIPYFDFIKELKNSKFTLIIKPWTKNDSLNIRLYEALSLGVVPFVSDDYDLLGLQINRELFSDLGLTVSSSHDILNKVNTMSDEEIASALRDLTSYYKL
jgi:hypothetical protein